MAISQGDLSRSLGPITLWGLGVGYVISGTFFGWNLGLPQGGTLGLAIATFFVIIMYVTFALGYCELACAIPKAGGIFDYASFALGSYPGFLAGMSQIIEFVFAPPAIAAAIGAYFHLFFPTINALFFAVAAYLIFTGLNIYGVKIAASFELIMTVIAVLVLLIFVMTCLPYFHFYNLTSNAFPHGFKGIFLATPFAIWFFLGIEGIANMAEETINPQKNIIIGFMTAMLTQITLCIIIFIAAVGVGGWEKIATDSPLPMALSQIMSKNHILYRLLVTLSLIGLVASFHGILLAAGRITFEFGRVGYLPKIVGSVQRTFKTPAWALFVNMLIGILALLTGRTSELITIACFGALSVYAFSMYSLMKLKKNHSHLPRPFLTPFYPYTPVIALCLALISLMVMTLFNMKAALIYFTILFLSFLWFKFFVTVKEKNTILNYEAQT